MSSPSSMSTGMLISNIPASLLIIGGPSAISMQATWPSGMRRLCDMLVILMPSPIVMPPLVVIASEPAAIVPAGAAIRMRLSFSGSSRNSRG